MRGLPLAPPVLRSRAGARAHAVAPCSQATRVSGDSPPKPSIQRRPEQSYTARVVPGSSIREAAVAGRFYPALTSALNRTLDELLAGPPRSRQLDRQGGSERPAVLAMVPHAGYIYSGRIAGATFARIDVPEHVIVLCPNHTGLGRARALWSRGAWRTPLGDIDVAEDLNACLKRHAPLDEDELAHMHEHAI